MTDDDVIAIVRIKADLRRRIMSRTRYPRYVDDDTGWQDRCLKCRRCTQMLANQAVFVCVFCRCLWFYMGEMGHRRGLRWSRLPAKCEARDVVKVVHVPAHDRVIVRARPKVRFE